MRRTSTAPLSQLEQLRFIRQNHAFHFCKICEPFQVFPGEGLYCRIFRLSDPRDFQLHGTIKA